MSPLASLMHGCVRTSPQHKVQLDSPGVQQDLGVVFLDDAGPEVQNQVHHEQSVGDDVEDDPGRSVLLSEEGDAHRKDDQVPHHQHQHQQIPVEPRRSGSAL